MAGRIKSFSRALAGAFGLLIDFEHPPIGLKWRSNTVFICTTVGVGMSVDVFLYSLIVPVIPFILEDRIGAPREQLQSLTSSMLATYAGASVLFSPVAGFIADRTVTRQAPFLLGLFAMLAATILLFVGTTVPVLLLARALQGLSGGFVWTIGLALCIDTVGSEHLGKVTGTIFSFVSVSSLMGPVAGGFLYKQFGYVGVFATGAAVLVIDFVMRLLVIEKRIAAKYVKYSALNQNGTSENGTNDTPQSPEDNEPESQQAESEVNEDSPLLPGDESKYKIQQSDFDFVLLKKLPIFYCFRSPSLITANLVTFIQAMLLGVIDSTVPLKAQEFFGFNSLQAGLLFIPPSTTDFIFGPIAGWAIDKFGTKPVGVFGFIWLCPAQIALRLVRAGGTRQIAIYAAILGLNGMGLACVAAPAIVEAGAVIEKYQKANPGLFGERGPYGQSYGLNSMLFSAGLTAGPVIAGTLRVAIGYGNLNLVTGIICILTSIPCFLYLSGPVKKSK